MFKTWFLASRPWSLTASSIPIALGAALALQEHSLNIGLLLLTLLGGILTQVGTNFINTYGDYVWGVDTIESAVTCPQVVTGQLSPNSMKLAGILAFTLAGIIGLILTYFSGWPVLVIGMIGIIAGYSYTAGVCPYKYKGLGSILVFFLMGPLMVWPAYYIQTGHYSIAPALAAFPIGFLVAGILHANDIRDFLYDQQAGIKTLALKVGFNKSMVLYYLLYVDAYLFLIALIIKNILPWTAFLPIMLLPIVVRLLRQAAAAATGSTEQVNLLEGASAKFHLQFGILLVLGIVIYPYLEQWWR